MMKHNVYQSEEQPHDHKSTKAQSLWSEQIQEDGHLFYVDSKRSEWQNETDKAEKGCSRESSISETNFEHRPKILQNHTKSGPSSNSSSDKEKRLSARLKKMGLLPNHSSNDLQSGKTSTSNMRNSNYLPLDLPVETSHDVFLHVDPGRNIYGRRATLCETLFGFVAGHFLPGDSKIMVAGIIPDGPAMRAGGKIQIGDWVLAVNDLDVTHDNIDSLLNAITRSKEVKLTVQPLSSRSQKPLAQRSNSIISSTSSSSTQPNLSSSSLLRLVGPDLMASTEAEVIDPDVRLIPHVIMYLTTDVRSESVHSKKEDVLYQYPKDSDNKISDLRGLFETLPQLLVDVTDNPVKSSTILIESELIHVAYVRCEPEMLIIAAPSRRISLCYLNNLLRDLSRLLLVIYGSLQSAFKDPVNQRQMDQFFKVFLRQVLPAHTTGEKDAMLLDSLPSRFSCGLVDAVNWLPLNDSVRSILSGALSNYESADFAELSDDYYDIRRQYTVVGTTLFYKGMLIGSHLPKEDLHDISLYLKYTCLLQMSAAQSMNGQIVVWREAYPTRRYHDPSGEAPVLGYSEPVDARWFLLVVGMKKLLLTALLEAGGCSQWAEGSTVKPDSFYVDQARACLLQLEALDIPGSCELALRGQDVPATVQADKLLSDKVTVKNQPTSPLANHRPPTGRSTSSVSSMNKNDADNLSLASSGGEMRRTSSINSIESADSSASSAQGAPLNEKLKGKTSSRFLPSGEQISHLAHKTSFISNTSDDVFAKNVCNQTKISAGSENSLFHYLYFQELDGIFVTSNEKSAKQTPSVPSLHHEVIDNFYHAAMTIRHCFEQTLAERDPHKEPGRFAATHPPKIYEKGILFHFTPTRGALKERAMPLTYWVVGRLFLEPEPQQLYVCFQDGSNQNLVELAFKLGFGNGI